MLLWVILLVNLLSSKFGIALEGWFMLDLTVTVLPWGAGVMANATILVSSIILDLETWCARWGVPDASRLSELIPDFTLFWGKGLINLGR